MLGVMAGVLPAEARRVALAIGNAEYKVGRLANPVNDAAAVAATLEKQLRFDKVLLRPNLTLDGFRAALREMAAQARGAELGVVFFAGHGIEVGGRNYLIPTDAALAASADIDLEAIALDTVLRQLEGVTRLRLVILDACRNSPFPAATRSVRGLSRIEPDLGTLVAYAAKDGTLAEDGKGRHTRVHPPMWRRPWRTRRRRRRPRRGWPRACSRSRRGARGRGLRRPPSGSGWRGRGAWPRPRRAGRTGRARPGR
jgi:hypothetical protein